jgi:NDP-sugar pyrophosphorylase family protein
MKVMSLAGRMGTRLREHTEIRPKPMVEIGGRPILRHIMKLHAHHGFTDFIIFLGYKAGVIKEYFLNYEPMNADFTIELGRRNSIHFHGLEKEPLEPCSADGQLQVYEHAGYWQCMDTFRDWENLEKQWQSGRAKWRVWR